MYDNIDFEKMYKTLTEQWNDGIISTFDMFDVIDTVINALKSLKEFSDDDNIDKTINSFRTLKSNIELYIERKCDDT